jgi:glycolate dehydrogenase iron-sulfur subunit
MTATGCGVMLRDYEHVFAGDPAYAAKAARITALTRDPSEIIEAEWKRLAPLISRPGRGVLAFHPPCTLQHGFKINGRVERLLADAGYTVVPVPDAHLCCGSAGTYSILQPEFAGQLKENKLRALTARRPQVIASANIGCMTHLQSGTDIPIRHWIELIDELITSPAAARAPAAVVR